MFGKKKDGAAKKAAKTPAKKKAKKSKKTMSTAGQSRFGEGGLKAALGANIEKVLLGIVAAVAIFCYVQVLSATRTGIQQSTQPVGVRHLQCGLSSADSFVE